MPQINLLQQQKKSPDELWRTVSAWSVKFFLAVLVLLVAYYVYLIVAVNGKNQGITSLEQQLLAQQQDLSKISGKEELFTRQQQLQQLMTLVAGHPYWSNLLPALASATLKTANFVSFQAMNDGTITLSVSVPSTQDLDEFLQVFDLPEFNQNFYDIKVGSIGKAEVGNQLLTQFNVNMTYNPSLLQPGANQ
jgi:hypothetical protein